MTTEDAEGKTSEEYADDYYDYNGYAEDGALYLIDLDNGSVWISTAGKMIRYLTDERIDAVIDEQLLSVHIARKAADAVIEGDDVRIETVQEVIQSIERRNAATRRDVDISPESHDALLGMAFGIGMDRQVALVEMTDDVGIVHFFFGNEDGDAGPLRVVILTGHIEDVRADDIRHVVQDLGQPFGIILFIDVFDVLAA